MKNKAVCRVFRRGHVAFLFEHWARPLQAWYARFKQPLHAESVKVSVNDNVIFFTLMLIIEYSIHEFPHNDHLRQSALAAVKTFESVAIVSQTVQVQKITLSLTDTSSIPIHMLRMFAINRRNLVRSAHANAW
jgi:hypothetical protein